MPTPSTLPPPRLESSDLPSPTAIKPAPPPAPEAPWAVLAARATSAAAAKISTGELRGARSPRAPPPASSDNRGTFSWNGANNPFVNSPFAPLP
eukprot:3239849-Prymnesium_polylepis.1